MLTKSDLAHLHGGSLVGIYPEGADWNATIRGVTLTTLFDEAVKKYADLPCIDFMGTKLSYRELDDMVSKAAKGFQDMGVTKGTKIGFYMPNTHWHPVLFFGALKAGAVAVNYSTQYVEKELQHQIDDSGTTILVTADTPKPDTYGNATNLLKKTDLEKVIVLNLADTMGKDKSWMPNNLRYGLPVVKILNRVKNFFNFSAKGDVTYIEKFMKNDGNYKTVDVNPSDIAVLQYTGGTSGTPKGTELTHRNLTANVQQIVEYIADSDGKPDSPYTLKPGKSRMFAPLPYFHIFGMTTTMITPIHLGMETVMTLDPRDLETSLKLIERTKPDSMAAVPKQLDAAIQSGLLTKYNYSSINGIVTGGSALPSSLHKAIHNCGDGHIKVFPGYGLSETAPVLTINPLYGEGIYGSAGKPIPGVEIRICDPADPNLVLKVGEDGEIQAKGDNIMKGYHNHPEETDECMVTDDKGGRWFRTGDIGHVTEDGHLIITDRLKRMINVSGTGKKAWASQIEEAILNNEDIAECVVITVNKGTDKESAKAFIRAKEGKEITEEKLREFLATSLNKHEIPRYYEFVTEPLPLTAVGKPDWHTLEKQEAAKAQEEKTKGASPPPPTMAP